MIVDCSIRYNNSNFNVLDLLSTMDQHGVEKAVLISELPSGLANHLEILKIGRNYCDRLIVVPKIDYASPIWESDLDEYKNVGISAIKIENLGVLSNPLQLIITESIPSLCLWNRVTEYSMSIFARPTVWDSKFLPYLVNACPDTQLFIEASMISTSIECAYYDCHGRPRLMLPIPTMDRYTLWGLQHYKNVNLVLSSEYQLSRSEWPYMDMKGWHSLENLLWMFGSDRLTWGSDFPFTSYVPGYDKCIRTIKERLPEIKASVYANIMGLTAYKKLISGKNGNNKG